MMQDKTNEQLLLRVRIHNFPSSSKFNSFRHLFKAEDKKGEVVKRGDEKHETNQQVLPKEKELEIHSGKINE